MMFYHGKQEDYPYPLAVIKCLENPANIMQDFAALKVQLINVNKLSQQAMNKHGLAGIMTEAMRRIPSKDTERNYISVFSRLGHIAESTDIPDGFTKSTAKYMINVKSVENVESLIETSNQVPNKLKGEIS